MTNCLLLQFRKIPLYRGNFLKSANTVYKWLSNSQFAAAVADFEHFLGGCYFIKAPCFWFDRLFSLSMKLGEDNKGPSKKVDIVGLGCDHCQASLASLSLGLQ